MRRAGRVDDNQPQIVADLRRLGLEVAITSSLGGGFPDIVVARAGVNWLFEIKDANKPPSARKLTPAEELWHQFWTGQVDVITSTDDALRIMGLHA